MEAVILNDDGSTSRMTFGATDSAEDVRDKLAGQLTESDVEKIPDLNQRVAAYADLYRRRHEDR